MTQSLKDAFLSHGAEQLEDLWNPKKRQRLFLWGRKKPLRVEDLSDLSLSPRLVVLSGCVTGLTEINGQEPDSAAYKRLVLSRVQVYIKQSLHNKMIHNILQLTIFIGAALVTVTVALPEIPKLIPIFLSALVTIATAIANYYKFGERARDLFLTAEGIGQECNWFESRRGPYKGLTSEEAFSQFMDRIENLIKAQTQRSFAFVIEQPKEVQK
jgi:hypothetical protein